MTNRRAFLLGFLIVLSLAVASSSFLSGLTPYVDFAQAKKSSRTVQVLGILLPQTVEDETGLRFFLRDDHGEVMPVVYHGARPFGFDGAERVGAVGIYKDGVFQAQRLLVKCPSKYRGE
ncbi:MAG: cytochrome c maturation protein CcmE [Limnochordia bacterium]|jgi:cytochrome c-type biogenesis protein CcmE|nr:cytochrome c maturation protein CcmE [Bacillota bacterium]